MSYLFTTIISLVVALGSFVGAYKWLPLSLFESEPLLGTSITTIAGSDTLSASRTTINNNFTALNTGKFELSDWYATTSAAQLTSLANLATIGTITTGIWSGTAIGVSKGGTGTTSPSTYMVMLGNGSNGLTMASTTGTTNQVLTSSGAGAYPSWQTYAVDQTLSYNFTGTYFGVKNLSASSTVANPINLNGVSYSIQNSNGFSGSVLSNNGSGALSWAGSPRYIFSTSTPANAINGYATSTAFTIPAGIITASSTIDFSVGLYLTTPSAAGNCSFALRLSDGSTIASIGGGSTIATSDAVIGESVFSVLSANSISSQKILGTSVLARTGAINAVVANYPNEINGTASVNFANAQSLVINAQSDTANVNCRITHIKMVVNP